MSLLNDPLHPIPDEAFTSSSSTDSGPPAAARLSSNSAGTGAASALADSGSEGIGIFLFISTGNKNVINFGRLTFSRGNVEF